MNALSRYEMKVAGPVDGIFGEVVVLSLKWGPRLWLGLIANNGLV